ncbi:MAG: hypothetical protein KIS85_08040 [Anaerolineales bacterium]|nr:hypothetical protein [Anaerolineales bacterium]
MTYEEILEKAAAEGAIRVYRVSDHTGFVYRLKDRQYQARGLTATEGLWNFSPVLVSQRGAIERSTDGWHWVAGLPKRAQPIDNETAKANPGYSQLVLRQCYTCKQFRPEADFERSGPDADPRRAWECNECYARRQREAGAYEQVSPRKGDFLDKETVASPPPPEGKI